MTSNDTTSNGDQHDHSSHLDPPRAPTADTSSATIHHANTLQVPQPTRPRLSDRQYSTHIYALNQQHAQPLVGGTNASMQAHVPAGGVESLPMEALVTIRPSRYLQRNDTEYSASSGITVNEITPPQAMLDTVEARGPGTYRFVAQQSSRPSLPVPENSDAAMLEKEASVDYDVQSLDEFSDKITSKEYLDGLTHAYPLPEPTGPDWWNHLRHGVFSTYRRLFVLVLLANLMALLYCIWMNAQDLDRFTYNNAATAVGANLFAGTLMRHEHCINFFFRLFVALPRWLPVSIRRLAAKVYSYGGVHSSCGISGLAWYIYFIVLFFLQMAPVTDKCKAVACLGGFMLFLLCLLVVMSHPTLRAKFHDQWELCHRYCGWTCIATIWVQVVLLAFHNAELHGGSVGHALVTTPAFWFLIGITLLIIYPWLRLRRIHYTPEQLSSHAARLWFPNAQRTIPTCIGIKLSTSPWTENHSFATIPNAHNLPGFSVLVSNAGDWTKRIITSPPPYLWTRGAYTIGVMRIALLFKPLVVVATGSGIGPCLSFLQVHPSWPVRVVWSARFPELTYGREVMQRVFEADTDAVVVDTKKSGKPDLVGLVFAVREEVGAEAVVIISNPPTTRSVVYGLEVRGVPAFGAIFDS